MKAFNSKLILLVLAALTIGVAYAAVYNIRADEVNAPQPQWFLQGAVFGNRDSGVATTAQNTLSSNVLRRFETGTLNYDFPPIDPTANGPCVYSVATISVPGIKAGALCILGYDLQPSASMLTGHIDPVITAQNVIKLQACADGIIDGGSFNPPDASYTVGCFSNVF